MCIYCDVEKEPKRFRPLLCIMALQFQLTQLALIRRGVPYEVFEEIEKQWWLEITEEVKHSH